MNKASLTLYTIDQLEHHLESLASITATEAVYQQLASSDAGKKLLASLRGELEEIRNGYAFVMPHEQASMSLLAGLQGEERKLKSLIARIEGSKSFSKQVDEEILFVQSLIKKRKQLDREQH